MFFQKNYNFLDRLSQVLTTFGRVLAPGLGSLAKPYPHDGYFVTYFHPWEFFDLKEHPEYKMPFIIKNHSGRQMMQRLDNLIKMLKKEHEFITFNEFVICTFKLVVRRQLPGSAGFFCQLKILDTYRSLCIIPMATGSG